MRTERVVEGVAIYCIQHMGKCSAIFDAFNMRVGSPLSMNIFPAINLIDLTNVSLILVICCSANDVMALMIVDDYYADWPSDERKTERSVG